MRPVMFRDIRVLLPSDDCEAKSKRRFQNVNGDT